MVEGAKAKVMPIVKADVHAPIFCFPKCLVSSVWPEHLTCNQRVVSSNLTRGSYAGVAE